MKKLFILLLFIQISFAEEAKLCTGVVNFFGITTIKHYDAFQRLWSKLPITNKKTENFKNKIYEAIAKKDIDKIDNILDSTSNSLISILKKIKINDSETEFQKFRDFLHKKLETLMNRITKNELSILKNKPIKTLFVFYQYSRALDFIKTNDLETHKEISKPYGKGDAIRHMFINAIASRFGLWEFVKELSTKREESSGYIKFDESKWSNFSISDFNSFHHYKYEDIKKCNPEVSDSVLEKALHEKLLDSMTINRMDIHNNAIGINIGKENPCLQVSEIYSLVKEKYDNHKAKEIINASHRCLDIASNPKDIVKSKEPIKCLNTFSKDPELKLITPKKSSNGFTC